MNWPLALILWATTCLACAHRPPVPWVQRPDTREIWAVTVDSVALSQTMTVFQVSYPNEAAVCYGGTLRDTVFVMPGKYAVAKLLHLQTASAAQQDSATQFYVFGPRCPQGTVAIGHSHPYAKTWCDQSDPDARLLFSQRYALVSIVWCLSGEVQILYQDGRRNTQRWREP